MEAAPATVPTPGPDVGVIQYLPLAAIVGVLILVLPWWPWSRGWTYVPAVMVGVIALTVVMFTYSFE